MFLAWLIPIVIVISLVFIILLFVLKLKTSKKQNIYNKAGEESEQKVNYQIQRLIDNKLNGQGKAHPNFIFFVDKYKQHTSQIDNLVVTKARIFIIEIKGWKGNVVGNLDDKKWTKTKIYHRTHYIFDYDIKK